MKPKYNIVVGEPYTKDGEEKIRWNSIGVMLVGEKDGKPRMVMKLQSIPLGWDGFANVFPITSKKSAIDEAKEVLNEAEATELSDEPVDLSDIPF